MTSQPATAPPPGAEDMVEKVASDLERILTDDKAELVVALRDVCNSACTNKDAFLKARALLAKHGAL